MADCRLAATHSSMVLRSVWFTTRWVWANGLFVIGDLDEKTSHLPMASQACTVGVPVARRRPPAPPCTDRRGHWTMQDGMGHLNSSERSSSSSIAIGSASMLMTTELPDFFMGERK